MSVLPLSRVGEREEVANSRVTFLTSLSDHHASKMPEQKVGNETPSKLAQP